jgi:hypothetical protein
MKAFPLSDLYRAAQGITLAYFKSVLLREWRVEKFKQQYLWYDDFFI